MKKAVRYIIRYFESGKWNYINSFKRFRFALEIAERLISRYATKVVQIFGAGSVKKVLLTLRSI